MKNIKNKTREQFLKEIEKLNNRIAELEKFKAGHGHGEAILQGPERATHEILDNSKLQMWAFDGEYYSYLNKEWYDYTGQDRSLPLTVERWTEIVHPGDLEAAGEIWAEHWRTKTEHDNYFRLKRYDGEYRHFHCHAVPVFNDDGSFKHFQGFNVDITDRKQAEEDLKASEKRYRDLFENANDLIQAVNTNGSFIYVNLAWKKLLGYNDSELSNLTIFDIIHPDSMEHCSGIFKRVFSGEEIQRFETAFITKHSGKVYVEGSINCHFENGKPISTRGIFRDITKRKQAEKMLRDQEANLRAFMENASGFGVYTAGLIDDGQYGSRTTFASPSIKEILGIDNTEDNASWFKNIIPEDLGRVTKAHHVSRNTGKTFDETFRINHPKKKEVRWIHAISSPVRAPDGTFTHFNGLIMDVNVVKQADEIIKRSEEKYRSVIENMIDGYYRSDKEGNAILISPSVGKILGFDKSEIIGKKISDFYADPKDREVFLTEIKKTGSVENYPAEFKKKGGTNIFIETTSRIYYDENGGFAGVEGTFRDISDRKHAEEKIQKQNEFLNIVLESLSHPFYVIDANNYLIKLANSATGNNLTLGKTTCHGFSHNSDKPCHGSGHPCPLEIVKKTKKPVVVEHIHHNKDGNLINVEIHSHPIFDKNGNVVQIIEYNFDITERKQAGEVLRLSSRVLETSPDHISVVGTDYIYKYVNNAYTQAHGIPANQIIGTHVANLLGIDVFDKIVKPKLDKCLTGEDINFESWFTFDEIEKRYMSVSYLPLISENGTIDSLVVISHDITERKQAEDEIKKLSVAVEQSANTIVITDVDGNIEYTNPKFTELTGYTASEALGQNPRILNAGTQPKKYYAQLWKTITSGKTWKGEFHIKTKSGELFWENVTITPIKNNKGAITNYLAIKENITAEKQAAEDLKQHARQLQERNEELDAFSHTVAHDLKNPLATIFSFSNLILEDFDTLSKDDILKYIKFVISDSNRTRSIIDSLLLFASVRKEEIDTEELNMGNIVAETLTRIDPIIEKNNAVIRFPNTWPSAVGHSPWIEEVWANYLSNAIKYGGSPPQIEIGADIEKPKDIKGGMVRFWVRDNGPGISAANQKLLFKQFERLDQAKTEGHGLGLSIVQRIIQKLGGQVGVESRYDELPDGLSPPRDGKTTGSLFYFTLPYNPNAGEKNIYRPEIKKYRDNIVVPKTGGRDENGRKLKILIVEDDYVADMHLSIILEDISKEILHAKTGIQAVEICRNNPDIDLILMDIKIPGMDGYEATRQIRGFNKNVTIVAQTAYALDGDRRKTIEAGCDDYIAKPIKKDKLIKIIGTYIREPLKIVKFKA